MISNNIMKVMEWKGSQVWYRIGCGANGCDQDDSLIIFEFDEDSGHITIQFEKKLNWNMYWSDDWLIKKIWSRVKAAIKILFKGNIELEGSFLIEQEEHLNDFIMALREGEGKMLKFKEEEQLK